MSAQVDIADNDAATVTIAATDATAAEPADDGRFTVTLSQASATDTVIDYSITGTAANGTDFALLSGQVTILAGATHRFHRRRRHRRGAHRGPRIGHRHAHQRHPATRRSASGPP